MPGEGNQAENANENNEEVQPVLANEIHYFPGITLKFCVSDIGLQALERGCKLLRRITMNKISNHSPAQVNFLYFLGLTILWNIILLSIVLTLVEMIHFYLILAWYNAAWCQKFDKRTSETRIHKFWFHWKNFRSSVIQYRERSS